MSETKKRFLVLVECEVESTDGPEAMNLVSEHLSSFAENAPAEVLHITVNKGHRLYSSSQEMFDEIDHELAANPTPSSASGGC